MKAAGFARSRQQLMVKLEQSFVVISVDVFEPPRPVGTVFCIHDFAGESRDFQQLASLLVASRYRVICPDLPGRGGSTFMSTPAQYANRVFLRVLVAVMEHFAMGGVVLLGKGWGALTLLLLLHQAKADLSAVILSDLPARWTVESDPAIADAAAISGRLYPTEAAAIAAILATSEFAGVAPAAAAALAANRVRPLQGGFAAHFDPQLLGVREHQARRPVDIAAATRALKTRLLLLLGPRLDPATAAAFAGPAPQSGPRTLVDGLQPGGRLSMTTAAEMLVILGFLKARVPLP